MFTKIPPLRARMVGTRLGTRLSIFRRSRGSSPCSEQRRDFLNTPEVEVAEPVESKMVQRSMMSGDNWVVPRPVNVVGAVGGDVSGGGRGGDGWVFEEGEDVDERFDDEDGGVLSARDVV